MVSMIQLFFLVILLCYIYAFPAVFIIRNKRKKALAAVETALQHGAPLETLHPKLQTEYLNKVAAGTTFPQMASFVLSIVLLALPVLAGLTAIGMLPGVDDNYTFYFLFALMFLTPLTVVVNAFWIYPKEMLLAEGYAFLTQTNKPILKTERVLAWVMWLFYIVGGLVLILVAGGIGIMV